MQIDFRVLFNQPTYKHIWHLNFKDISSFLPIILLFILVCICTNAKSSFKQLIVDLKKGILLLESFFLL